MFGLTTFYLAKLSGLGWIYVEILIRILITGFGFGSNTSEK